MNHGRIDVHSHLIPGVDDGCQTLEESLACAQAMVAAGYTHLCVTPHVWPSNKHIHVDSIPQWAATLQAQLDVRQIDLKLIPGGEINMTRATMQTPRSQLITYAMAGKFALVDLWADTLPDFFDDTVRWFASLGVTMILAHPERMRAVQKEPELADRFADLGVKLQGNLQCLSDPSYADTYRTIRRFLDEDRYFLLGSDLHKLDTLDLRLRGLKHAIEVVGSAKVDELTRTNPAQLLNGALV